MGSRGSFIDVNTGNFEFKEGGKLYHSIGEIDGVKIIIKDKGSVNAPEYSHTANRAYAVVQNGKLKHVAFYDEGHHQMTVIDLMHEHHGIMPHKHYNLDHTDKGIPINEDDIKIINKIKRRFGLI